MEKCFVFFKKKTPFGYFYVISVNLVSFINGNPLR